jgi:hypothetical protein
MANTQSSPAARRAPKGVPAWVVRSAMAGTTLLVVASFILSFAALTDLAARAGIPGRLAWLWPLIVDGLIVVATAAIIALAGHPKRTTWFAWVLLFGGAGVSIAGNATHAVLAAGQLESGFPMTVSALVAAVPPVVLLAVTHLLVVLIREQSPAAASVKKAPAKTKKAPAAKAKPAEPVAEPVVLPAAPAPQPQPVPQLAPQAAARELAPATLEAAAEPVVDDETQPLPVPVGAAA